jgi:hypothetical protein
MASPDASEESLSASYSTEFSSKANFTAFKSLSLPVQNLVRLNTFPDAAFPPSQRPHHLLRTKRSTGALQLTMDASLHLVQKLTELELGLCLASMPPFPTLSIDPTITPNPAPAYTPNPYQQKLPLWIGPRIGTADLHGDAGEAFIESVSNLLVGLLITADALTRFLVSACDHQALLCIDAICPPTPHRSWDVLRRDLTQTFYDRAFFTSHLKAWEKLKVSSFLPDPTPAQYAVTVHRAVRRLTNPHKDNICRRDLQQLTFSVQQHLDPVFTYVSGQYLDIGKQPDATIQDYLNCLATNWSWMKDQWSTFHPTPRPKPSLHALQTKTPLPTKAVLPAPTVAVVPTHPPHPNPAHTLTKFPRALRNLSAVDLQALVNSGSCLKCRGSYSGICNIIVPPRPLGQGGAPGATQ